MQAKVAWLYLHLFKFSSLGRNCIKKKLKEIFFFLVSFTSLHILVVIQSAQRSVSDSIGKRGGDCPFFRQYLFLKLFQWKELNVTASLKNKLNGSKSQQVLKANQIPEEKDTLKCHVQFFHVLKTKEKNIVGMCSKQSPGYSFTSFGPSKITLSTKQLTVGEIKERKNNLNIQIFLLEHFVEMSLLSHWASIQDKACLLHCHLL